MREHQNFLTYLSLALLFVLPSSNLCPEWPLQAIDHSTDSIKRAEEEQKYVSYVSDPNGRGTPTLVLSCVLTLVLCVWSALHLNVPCQGERRIQALFVYIRWILTGVFGPELVAFTAWRQWCSARLLRDLADQRVAEAQKAMNEESKKIERRHKWTMVHSFFASGGGFAFDIESLPEIQFLPVDCPARLTLTARGVALLIKCGFVPNIAEENVLDKSKSNGLAKALVLVQALWMLFQVLGRLIAGLPVTLLEVNTVAHV